MHTVRTAAQSELDVVVDNQRNAVGMTKLLDFQSLRHKLLVTQMLFAQLQDCNAAFERFLYHLDQRSLTVAVLLGNGV